MKTKAKESKEAKEQPYQKDRWRAVSLHHNGSWIWIVSNRAYPIYTDSLPQGSRKAAEAEAEHRNALADGWTWNEAKWRYEWYAPTEAAPAYNPPTDPGVVIQPCQLPNGGYNSQGTTYAAPMFQPSFQPMNMGFSGFAGGGSCAGGRCR